MAKAKLTEIPEGTPELRFGISGKSLIMRPALTLGQKVDGKDERKGGGNLVWGVMRSGSKSLETNGVVIRALADELPTQAVVYNPESKDKFVVDLVDGPATYTNPKTKVTTENSPHKVYKGEHQVPGTEHSRVLTVKVTARKDEGWNLKAILTNAGGSPAPVEDIFAEDDLVEDMFA